MVCCLARFQFRAGRVGAADIDMTIHIGIISISCVSYEHYYHRTTSEPEVVPVVEQWSLG